MFWSSVLDGFGLLVYWEVWVALAVYAVLAFAWLMLLGMIMGDDEDQPTRKVTGCLIHSLLSPALNGLTVAAMVAWLMPIMLGGVDPLPLRLFAGLAVPIAVAALIAIVSIGILELIPVLGGVVVTPGAESFLQGLVVFRLFSQIFIDRHLAAVGREAGLYPGFWVTVGFFLISLIVSYLGMVMINALISAVWRGREPGEGVMILLGPTLVRLVGLIPLFMYASWVVKMLGGQS